MNFVYDHRGRRVEKRVYKRDSSDNTAWAANPIERRRFVWNGWLMLREVIDTDANADGDLADTGDSTRTKMYTWGRDLGAAFASCGAGVSAVSCLESAGGIGGLLSVYDDNATTTGENPTADDLKYVYLYDANGNVGQLCNLSANDVSSSLVAKYEYDAYGTPTVSSGTYAASNTYHFSTKPWDDETGLGYWGYRYYDAKLGRWMNRDPIEEAGGLNLYEFASNNPSDDIDSFGEQDFGGGYPVPPECGQVSDPHCQRLYGRCDTGWIRYSATTKKGRILDICECFGTTRRYAAGGGSLHGGPQWPACCGLAFNDCLGNGGSFRQCQQTFLKCLNSLEDNPCHADHAIDGNCWYFKGKGCKRPEECFISLFPACDTPLAPGLAICSTQPTHKGKGGGRRLPCGLPCVRENRSLHEELLPRTVHESDLLGDVQIEA